ATQLHAGDGINTLGSMMMYNWSESQGYSWYDNEFEYLVNSTFYANIFNEGYRDPLKQYHLLTTLGDGYGNYEAIGFIMKAYHYQLMVDFYGDIPYTEALLRSDNATPAYDLASEVYTGLMVDLTTAVDLIDAAAGDAVAVVPDSDDVMFGGDMTMWKQFANTLKVRILTRLSDMASMQGYIQTEFDAITAEGSGFITANVVVDPGYEVSEGKQNPYWDEMGFTSAGTEQANYRATCATQYILDYLTSTNDPRISFLYEEPTTGHLGVNQGLDVDEEYAPELVSNIGPGILKSATMGDIIFTLAESNFNRAELALKGFGGDPQALYEAGISAAFVTLSHDAASLTAADASAYYAQSLNNVSYTASADKLEAIITQKWLAVNGLTAEQSWFDYSRTGFPSNLPISAQASTTDRPVRLFYPASESASNASNVPDQPNAFSDKIFWAN
ncbi:SusD/RagB family nutrient-binding outer membrane lipoprotein, partial [Gilvimarinus agarilyticus]|nr:SusD/RagB family nutrient-binding outer membrane lipoprotein [Gilvimarinus agarilyticus]